MRRTITALTIAVALVGLTACSGSPSATKPSSSDAAAPTVAAGQTAAEACGVLDSTMTEATKGFTDAESDPAAAVASLQDAVSALDSLTPKITNAEVAALMPPLKESFSQLTIAMDALIKGDVSKASELTDLMPEIQDTMEKLQTICGTD